MQLAQIILLTACALAAFDHTGRIVGVAVNGTAKGTPLANAEVVLRVADNGSFLPIAETTTDAMGRFTIGGLPVDGSVLYLPGVNHHGVHYPGERIQLRPGRAAAEVRLVAYDAVESPSPLVSPRHELHVRPASEYLEVEETLIIDNPSLTTYVGQEPKESEKSSPVTLRLSLPDGLDKVTFEKEFHGRNFWLNDGILMTSIPFRPGTQEFKFSYRLPAEIRQVFGRHLDRPTSHVIVRVTAKDPRGIECNLGSANETTAGQIVFEQRATDRPFPTGYAVELQLGSPPISFTVYARWLAGGLLAVMMVGTFHVIRLSRSH